jgi:hypothetical protein
VWSSPTAAKRTGCWVGEVINDPLRWGGPARCRAADGRREGIDAHCAGAGGLPGILAAGYLWVRARACAGLENRRLISRPMRAIIM